MAHGPVPTLAKSLNFWTSMLIFGLFERALTVESAERITGIKSLLFRESMNNLVRWVCYSKNQILDSLSTHGLQKGWEGEGGEEGR